MVRTIGVVGVSDPRHSLFLEPVRRRRAGIRVVGLADPDDRAREAAAAATGLPAFADLAGLLDARPDVLAVSGPDVDAVIAGLRAGLDVAALAPSVRDRDELARLEQAVDGSPGRLLAVHPWRGHPAVRLVRQLIADGTLGRPERGLVAIGHGRTAAERLRDLADAADVMSVLAPGGSEASAVEVVDLAEEEGAATLVQLAGASGGVQWDTVSGAVVVEALDRPPVRIAAGPPTDEAAWVLTAVLRAAVPDGPVGRDALASTRTALDRR